VASTNAAVNTNAAIVAPITVGPNTPEVTASENFRLGNLAAVFILFLTFLALKRK
jgi:hypothetical protein